MLLHELGHATYQRLLIPDGALPGNGHIPEFWAGAEVSRLTEERDRLQAAEAAARAAGQAVPASITARLAVIERIFVREMPHEPWGALPQETRELYDAWTILRGPPTADAGKYLMAVDFNSRKVASDRRLYQAGAFGEFIAESFFLTATGAMDAHIQKMRTDPGVPDDVRQAWAVADRILGQHARQTVLGRPPTV
jgi:hypothetical protein